MISSSGPYKCLCKLHLLAEIAELAGQGRDLRDIFYGALVRVASGTGAEHVGFLVVEAEGWWRVSVADGLVAGAAETVFWPEFPIEGGGVHYGRLRIERHADALTKEDRDFVLVAAGLLAGALLRLRAQGHAAFDAETDIVRGQISPMIDVVHRIRNILSVIRVVVRRTGERAASIEDYTATLESRISALARVQTALLGDASGKADLAMLIGDEMVAQSVREDRVVARGPRILLQARAAQALGLTIHELAENAVKFGALSARNGKIAVEWWIEETPMPRTLRFCWVESGVSLMSSAPRSVGFGHELIQRTLPYELAATTNLDFRPGGLRCDLAIPLSQLSPLGPTEARA